MSRLPRDCQRFETLCEEKRDRSLTDAEVEFLSAHRFSCAPCADVEMASEDAMNVLRTSALDAETEYDFDRRLLRRLKSQTVKEGFNYWTPAVIGAALACFAVFAALSLLSESNVLPTATPRGQASRRFEPIDERTSLELSQPVRFTR